MKWRFFMLLLTGAFVVRGQQRPGLFDAIPRWHPDSVLVKPIPERLLSIDGDHGDWQGKLLELQQSSVLFMPPDKMSCWMPDMSKVERMPVSRLWNAEKMPNPLKGRGSGHPLYH